MCIRDSLKAKSPAADYSSILGTKLWYVSDLAQTLAATSVDYVDVIGFSQLTRPDDIGGEIYLELTVLGNKRDLESKFLEFDNGDFIPTALGNSSGADVKRRQLFTRTVNNPTDDGDFRAQNYYFQQSGTQVQVSDMQYEVRVVGGVNQYVAKVTTVTDHGLVAGNTIIVEGAIPSTYNTTGAIVLSGVTSKYFEYELGSDPGSVASGNIELTVPISEGNKIFPYGEIVDYSEVITPVIGVCKPKNISLQKRGAGFNQETDKILSKGRDASGNEVYNSIFKVEYFNPVFFTKLTLDSPVTTGFTAGKYITGQQSGAYAVVEGSADSSYSSFNTLHVRVVSGAFISGETIIDEAGNVLRIAKENTISHFIVTKRGSQYSQSTSEASTKPLSIDGKAIDVSTVKPIIVGGQVISVDINDRKALKEEYVSSPQVTVNFDAGTPPTSSVVRAVLFKNTVLTYTNESVKSLFSEFGDGEVNKFTADVETFDGTYSTSKDVTSSTFEGAAGKKILTCLAFSGNPTIDLLPGDIVEFVDSTGVLRRNIVETVTPPSGLVRGQVYLDTALHEDVSNATLVRKRTKISNPENSSLLFPLGFKSASSLIQDSDDTKIRYYIRRDFITTSSTSGGQITFSAQLKFGTQRFIEFRESNFLLTVLDKGNSDTGLENGDVMYITGDQVSALSSGGVSITLDNLTFRSDASSASNVVLKLTATIEVDKASPKTKTAIRNKRVVVVSSGDKVIPIRGYDYDAKTADVISYADVFGSYGTDIRVFEGSVSNPPTLDDQNNVIEGYDVTERFTFDDGQRDTFYDVSRLVLKPGFDAPLGQLVVVFNYFEHSAGDFCTVDSYLLTGVPTTDIPYFNSPSLGRVYLADVVDFRPKVDVNSIISGFQDKALLSSNNTISFNGSGGIPSATPAHDENLEYTFGFNSKQYLDRIDGIFLNKKGDFIVKKGNSSLNPSKPESPDDAIALYYLFIPAYTENVKDIRVTPVDNRRYTMRDIGKLEKRVERLEYYTTLSILEQQTFNTQIKDDVGLDRFKSGIIVDNFENHAVGNLKSLDYKCSIDTQQSVLTAPTVENSYGLREISTTDQDRSVSGYEKTGHILTLPYATQDFVSNKFATADGKINPNPFVVVQYVGDASISPSIDHWYDNTQTPNILNNDTKVFSVFVNKADAREGYASLNNFYITNWVGTNRAFFNISSLNDVVTNTEANVIAATVSTSSNISPQNNEIGKGITTTTNGQNTVASSIQLFARSKAIKFTLRRLKPNTKFYTFIEGRNVVRYVCQDTKFTGIPGNSLGPFGANLDGSSIKTDSNGDASGLLIFPAGTPPLQNSSWTGDINSVSYETDGEELNFTTGIKTIRFTTSEEDANDESVDSFAECKYYCTGTFPNQPASIISTVPSFLKGAEGVQFIDNASTQAKPSPLSQTFRVENMDGGCFVTSVDLYFAQKSDSLPVRVYLSDTNSGKPGSYIIPGTEIVRSSDTYLKVYASGTLDILIGETISGFTSGVKGIVKKVVDQNGNDLLPTLQNTVSINNDQVYTLILSNYTSLDGSGFQPNEGLSIPSLTETNTLNNTTLTVTIAKDSGRIVGLNISDYGEGYDSATLVIQSPQLPGGSVATANVFISNGEVFDTSILLEGSGYTDAPSIILRPNGSISREAVIEPVLEIDTPAVRMGVSVDPQDGQTLDSVSPTRFTFDHPIYLQNNTDYTLGIETDSTDYRVWSSKLGETDISTSQVITQQPLLGSVFRSQNVDAWTEDLSQDIKFVLKRAVFVTDTPANIRLTNEELGYELLDNNPIQTDSSSNDSADSLLFRNNNRIVKVSHRNSGFEDSGKSYVTFRQSTDVGGIEGDTFNSTLFQVSNSGLNSYNITNLLGAGSSTFGGGDIVLASYNRKYEKLYPKVGYLSFSDTPFNVSVKTTNIIPQDSTGTNYVSYSQTDYETTFLNEEHFFDNQKVIASSFNEVKNNIDESLEYKFTFSTTKDNLSPVIDLRSSSVKCISTQIDKPVGNEVRFGIRYKLLSFYPLYKFNVTNLPVDQAGDPIIPTVDQSVTGDTSNCRGDIIKVVGSLVYVKVTNSSVFQAGETLTFGVQAFTGVAVSPDGITRVVSNFTAGTQVEVYQENLSDRFGTEIYGTIISWDDKTETLTVLEEKAPIEGDYTSPATGNFARNSSNGGDNQVSDIIRVGDNLWHQNISPADATDLNESVPGFVEVSAIDYSSGVGFTSDTSSKNSTSLAKYVTKEVTLANPATTIEVRLSANMAAQDDVCLLYTSPSPRDLSTSRMPSSA